MGKARERKHLGIEARRIAAALRELALGLVAVLLGYDEKAAGLPPGAARRDLGKQKRGFARSGTAQNQPQHGAPSFEM